MAKNDVEAVVTMMRRIAPERFKVVTGVVRGPLLDEKVLEPDVSLVVARDRVMSEHRKSGMRELQKRLAPALPAKRAK